MEKETSDNVRFHYFDGQSEDVQMPDELSHYAIRRAEGSEDHHSFRLRVMNVSGDDTEHYDEMTWG